MTANQIAYQRLLEDRRANLAKERLEKEKVTESIRHNYVTEDIDTQKLGESKRHNLVSESLDQGNLTLNQGKLNESIRHNTVSESSSVGGAISQTAHELLGNVSDWIPKARDFFTNTTLSEAVGRDLTGAADVVKAGIAGIWEGIKGTELYDAHQRMIKSSAKKIQPYIEKLLNLQGG